MHQSVMAQGIARKPGRSGQTELLGCHRRPLVGIRLWIAQRLTTGLVIANDRDAQSLELARANTEAWTDRIRYHQGPLQQSGRNGEVGWSRQTGWTTGRPGSKPLSAHCAGTGFSILADGPLDMRMDQSTGMTAADLVNHNSEKELADLIFQLGEERRARRIARALVRARPIRSTRHLADVVERAVPRTGRLHPATRTFMALRMR